MKWRMPKNKSKRNGRFADLKNCQVISVNLHDSSLDYVKARACHRNVPPSTEKQHTHTHTVNNTVPHIRVDILVTQRQVNGGGGGGYRKTDAVLTLHLGQFSLEMKTNQFSLQGTYLLSAVPVCLPNHTHPSVCTEKAKELFNASIYTDDQAVWYNIKEQYVHPLQRIRNKHKKYSAQKQSYIQQHLKKIILKKGPLH